MIEANHLIRIPQDKHAEASVDVEQFRNSLNDTSFILIKGRVNLNDFAYMRVVLDRFNDIIKFCVEASQANSLSGVPSHQKKQLLRKAQDEATISKSMLDGFKLFFDTFYQDRVIVKIMPFKGIPNARFVGDLNRKFLRDSISSIIYKYGTAPISDWAVFAQIASIPPRHRAESDSMMSGSDMEIALQKLFDGLRAVEITAQSVVFPEIAVTPIAIYREPCA